MPALSAPTRRPALIPHSSDLSLSLSAASAALSSATYSPARETPEDLLVLTPAATTATTPELGGEEFRRDVFSWVNSDDEDGTGPQALTAPTSPREASSFDAIEKQRRRLAASAC